MSLSIPRSADGALHALATTRRQQERTLQKLAGGKRIATAADDAAGLAIAKRLESQVRGLGRGEQNLADGQGLVRVADGALQQSHDSLARMRELAVQAQNGTLGDADRATLQQEYDQLAASLDQTAGGTRYGDRTLLDGSSGGAGAVAIDDGSGAPVSLDLPAADAAALGVGGRSVGDPATLSALDSATDSVSMARARLGALDNRLGHHAESLAAAREATEAARSRIEDADVAFEVASLVQLRLREQVGIASLVKAGRHGRSALDLLG